MQALQCVLNYNCAYECINFTFLGILFHKLAKIIWEILKIKIGKEKSVVQIN